MEFIFSVFDRNMNGILDRDEIANIIGQDCTEEMVNSVLRDMKVSGDRGSNLEGVTVQDFVAYTKRVPAVAAQFSQKAISIVAFACANGEIIEVG